MPTYDYRCEGCGHELAALQSIRDEPLKTCPKCGKDLLRRRIGAGAGIIFKGSGFYETDYKRNRTSSKDGKGGGTW
jgi:putative FmdB family regulatory protein